MEIAPTVLIGLGDVPARALLRFKEEAAWRPVAARQAVQVLVLGQAQPQPDFGLAALLADWHQECHWLGAPEARMPWNARWLGTGLRPAWDRALSARGLDRLWELPGYRPRVIPHQERFAPEVCVIALADGPEQKHIGNVVSAAAELTGRPVHLVLALPAPHDENWVAAAKRVSELERLTPGPAGSRVLARVWLISRERATGELLEGDDVEGALSNICRLVAYSGWPGDPSLARLFRPQPGEPIWGTLGVRVWAWPVAQRYPRALIAAARTVLTATAGPDPGPMPISPPLYPVITADERDPLLRRALPAVEEPPSPHSLPADEIPAVLEGWWSWLNLDWRARAQTAVQLAAERMVQQAQEELKQEWQTAGGTIRSRVAQVRAAQGAVHKALEDLAPPQPDPDVSWAVNALVEAARRRVRWIPAVIRAIMTTALVASGARVFSGPGDMWPALVVTVAGWALWLMFRNVLDRRRISARMDDLMTAVRSWAMVGGAEATYYAVMRALRDLERWLDEHQEEDIQRLELLEEAGALLEGLVPETGRPSDPAVTHWTDPVGELRFTRIPGLDETILHDRNVEAVASAAVVQARALFDAGILRDAVSEPLLRAFSAAAAEQAGPVPVLLPLRMAVPESGEPMPAVTVSLTAHRPSPDLPPWPDDLQTGDDPFALVRLTLSAPIPLSGTLALADLHERGEQT